MPLARREAWHIDYDRLHQVGQKLGDLIADALEWLETRDPNTPRPPLLPLQFKSGPHRILVPRGFSISGGMSYLSGLILNPSPSLLESCLNKRDCFAAWVNVESIVVGPSREIASSGVDLGEALVSIDKHESPVSLTGLAVAMALAVEAGELGPDEYRDFIERLSTAIDEAFKRAYCALNSTVKTVTTARIMF